MCSKEHRILWRVLPYNDAGPPHFSFDCNYLLQVLPAYEGAAKTYQAKPGFTCIATSGDGYIAVGSNDGKIRLYGSKKGMDSFKFSRATTTIASQGMPITAIDISYDGRFIVATSDRFIAVIQVRLGRRFSKCCKRPDLEGCAQSCRDTGMTRGLAAVPSTSPACFPHAVVQRTHPSPSSTWCCGTADHLQGRRRQGDKRVCVQGLRAHCGAKAAAPVP